MSKHELIPEYKFSNEFKSGIVIGRAVFTDLPTRKEVSRSHRDEWHLFLLQEEGVTSIEIDFHVHWLTKGCIAYIQPNQIHRVVAFENAVLSSWLISKGNLKPEYLDLLDRMAPVQALALTEESFTIFSAAVTLGITLFEKQQEGYLNPLKDIGNALVALVISHYLASGIAGNKSSRRDSITKEFRIALEHNFLTIKSPSAYAGLLHLSPPYLNQCVRNATGYPVSHHIQQRIMLEAERLLYHSTKSVKEVAHELGYDDYAYFTRLFTKVKGMTPLAFRNRNLD